jgi:2-hydroxy-3-keto-5-methylthiopentenyl-1-phosphate phosphatase
MGWHVFVDFDGTISHQDSTDILLERFADPAWREIESSWQAGLIGSRQCMAEQVTLLRMSEAELESFIDGIEIDPAFPAFIAACRACDIDVSVVSDGLDRIVGGVLARCKLANLAVCANALVFLGDNNWRLHSPHRSNSCRSAAGTCKCQVAARYGKAERSAPKLTLLIGDGRSDQCLAEEADFVLAKSALAPYCGRRNIPHLAFTGFADVLTLPALLAESRPETIVAARGTLDHV